MAAWLAVRRASSCSAHLCSVNVYHIQNGCMCLARLVSASVSVVQEVLWYHVSICSWRS
jgi:hypothetical protein